MCNWFFSFFNFISFFYFSSPSLYQFPEFVVSKSELPPKLHRASAFNYSAWRQRCTAGISTGSLHARAHVLVLTFHKPHATRRGRIEPPKGLSGAPRLGSLPPAPLLFWSRYAVSTPRITFDTFYRGPDVLNTAAKKLKGKHPDELKTKKLSYPTILINSLFYDMAANRCVSRI
ncbi:hypothetical protein PUN28_003381 [Cardiocondyla obscurior]|uniref:Uncharacterized protein n=1 Tax=Cardiocondyla obscurior TaxID=286306 RepID=A0AAW2GIP4_9HYME